MKSDKQKLIELRKVVLELTESAREIAGERNTYREKAIALDIGLDKIEEECGKR